MARLWITFVSNICLVLGFGYQLAFLNFSEAYVRCWLDFMFGEPNMRNSTDYYAHCESANQRMNTGEFDAYTGRWSLSVTGISIGAVFGPLIFGPTSDRLGRMKIIRLIAVLCVVASVLQGAAWLASSYALLVFARIVSGVGCGGVITVVPVYLAEIAPDSQQAVFGTSLAVALNAGFFLASVFGLPQVFGNYSLWPWTLILSGILFLVGLLGAILAPESPDFLDSRGYTIEANKARWLLYGDVGPNKERAKIVDKVSVWIELTQVVKDPAILRAVLAGCMLMMFQIFTGVSAMIFYSTSIFVQAGLDDSVIGPANCGFFAFDVLFGLVTVYIINMLKRTTLCTISAVGMLVCTLSIFALGFFKSAGASYSSLAIIVIYMGFADIGILPLPFMLLSEWVPVQNRSTAQSIAIFSYFFFQIIIGLLFPLSMQHIGNYTFLAIAVFCVLCAVYVSTRVVESKGRTVPEVLDIYRQRSSWL